MIVTGFSEMKRFLPSIEMKGQPTVFDDALEMAQDALVSEILGHDLELLIERNLPEDAKLRRICQRIISVQAFLKSIPEMDLVLTDSGFAVISNNDLAPASKERVASLTAGLSAKLDESKDDLVTFLMRTAKYDDWRGTEEFARISDALILTYAEFKDLAILNDITAPAYPHSWSDFMKLNSALNVALMTDVASYISKEYAEEILEKIRDKETFLPAELKAVKIIKIAIAAIALGDRKAGMEQAIKAFSFMKSEPDIFTTFAASPEASDLTLTHDDSPIFMMF